MLGQPHFAECYPLVLGGWGEEGPRGSSARMLFSKKVHLCAATAGAPPLGASLPWPLLWGSSPLPLPSSGGDTLLPSKVPAPGSLPGGGGGEGPP